MDICAIPKLHWAPKIRILPKTGNNTDVVPAPASKLAVGGAKPAVGGGKAKPAVGSGQAQSSTSSVDVAEEFWIHICGFPRQFAQNLAIMKGLVEVPSIAVTGEKYCDDIVKQLHRHYKGNVDERIFVKNLNLIQSVLFCSQVFCALWKGGGQGRYRP